MFVPTAPPPASPQAQELGQKLARTVRDYLASHPGVGGADVHQAFGIARSVLSSELGGLFGGLRAALATALGLLLCLGLGVFFFWRESGGEAPDGVPWMMLAVVGLALVGAAVAVLARSGR